jgi:hypothetical protein
MSRRQDFQPNSPAHRSEPSDLERFRKPSRKNVSAHLLWCRNGEAVGQIAASGQHVEVRRQPQVAGKDGLNRRADVVDRGTGWGAGCT